MHRWPTGRGKIIANNGLVDLVKWHGRPMNHAQGARATFKISFVYLRAPLHKALPKDVPIGSTILKETEKRAE